MEIWPKAQIKRMVAQAIDGVGGKRAFEFIGPHVREVVIEAACWRAVNDAVMCNAVTFDRETFASIHQAFRTAAGIDTEDI